MSTNGLWVEVHCRHCGGKLEQAQPGRTDGVTGMWSAQCEACGRGYVLRLELAALSTGRAMKSTRAAHGTRTRYGAGCRCDECREAQATYYRKKQDEKKGAA